MKLVSLFVTRGLLLASGSIAICTAAMILFAPSVFYAGYGIDIGGDLDLANELKAPAGALLASGLVMLAGAFRSRFTILSLATATAVYLSYGLSRTLSMAIDGVPHTGLVGAAVIEVAIGAICWVDLMRHRRTAKGGEADAKDIRSTTVLQDAA
jgi:hypothetical protein